MKFADENKNGNLSLREFKKLVELAEDMDSSKQKQGSKKWKVNEGNIERLNASKIK